MTIPGITTVTPAPSTVKVNGKDVPVTEKVRVPAQQAKAEELIEGLMKQLAEAKAEAAAAKAAVAMAGKRVRKVELRVSAKGAISAYGLGRWPVTLYWQQWMTIEMMANNITEEQYWANNEFGKFTILHRDVLSSKEE